MDPDRENKIGMNYMFHKLFIDRMVNTEDEQLVRDKVPALKLARILGKIFGLEHEDEEAA